MCHFLKINCNEGAPKRAPKQVLKGPPRVVLRAHRRKVTLVSPPQKFMPILAAIYNFCELDTTGFWLYEIVL